MNVDEMKGKWKQLSGSVKEQWGKLTDDDIAEAGGDREQLEGKIQERYGKSKEEARKEVDTFMSRQ